MREMAPAAASRSQNGCSLHAPSPNVMRYGGNSSSNARAAEILIAFQNGTQMPEVAGGLHSYSKLMN